MKNFQNNQKGFTLIELMIVVAIIGILQLSHYLHIKITQYVRVTEALSVSAGAKISVAETAQDLGLQDLSAFNAASSPYAFTASKYVSSVGIVLGGIIQAQTSATGATINPLITLTPEMLSGRIDWDCTATGLAQHVPSRMSSIVD